jgi:hypothetical protein
MDIWVLYGYTPYEGEETFGVFSSEENAKEALKRVKLDYGKRWETYEYYLMLLDELAGE